ncbi:phage tail tape measure protein [Bacillus pseudomycoides]|nr:phage tail tape measure protein [Bacillus pseudomycoides]
MSQDMELGVRVSMDLRNFDSGVAGMNRKLKMVDSEFRAASEEAKRYGDSVSQLRTKMDYLSQKLEIQGQKVSHYRQEIDKLHDKQQQLRASSENLAGKMQSLEREYEQSAQATGRNSEQTRRLKQELDQVRSQYTASVQSLSSVNAAIDRNTTSLNRAREGEARLRNEIHETNEQLERQTSLFHRATERMQSIGNTMQDVGGTIGATFMSGATAAGLALGKAVSTAADFEAQMSRVGAIAGASSGELLLLKDSALELGSSTSKSASEVALGMENLAASGYNVNQIISAMPGIISAAEASGEDMAMVSETVASALNSFGLEAKEASHVADVLAQAANQSAAGVSDMQYTFKYAAPVAKMLGMSMEELAAATGIMADAGIKGEQSGTTLRAALLRLADPPKEAAEALDELGVNIKNTDGSMRPFADIVGDLKNKTDDMANAQKAAALSSIFGQEAVSGMLAVIEKGPDKLNAMTKALKESDGAAKATAKQMKDNLKGAVQELDGAMETAQITIGNALTPAIISLSNGIKGAVDWFNNLDESTQKTIATGAALTVGLVGVVGVLGLLTAAVGALLANPVVLGIVAATGAIAGLGLGLMKLSSDIKQAGDDVDKFGGKVSEGTRKAAGAYVDLKDKAISNMVELRTKTGEEADAAANETIQAFKEMTNEVVKELEGQKGDIEKMFGQLMQSIPEGTKGTLEAVKNNVLASIDAEIETAKKAEEILAEGVKKYQADTSKMPKDFAAQYEEALRVADKNVQQFYTKATELESLSKQIADGGMLSVSAGKKAFEEIIKTYDQGMEGLKKQTDGWRNEVEKLSKLGKVSPEERKATLDAIELYEKDHASKLIGIRNQSIDSLRKNLKEEDQEIVLANLEKIEKEDAHWTEKAKVALFGAETYSDVLERTDKEQQQAEKAHKDKLLEFEKQYGRERIESLDKFVGELQKGTESSKLLAETMAKDINGKMMIDLGPAGQFTVDSFLEQLKSGELKSSDVALANANKLKEVYNVDLTESGMDSMQTFTQGLIGKDTSEIKKALGVKLADDTNIDLGIYGQMSIGTWIEGLKNGTLSFDTVFQYFQTQVKNGLKIDASKEGKDNIQTLINGMKIGALSVNQVAKAIGLDIKNDTKVDLGESGTFTVATLVQGMQDGSVNAKTAAKAIAELIENGAKLDLTQTGSDISQTEANGITNNTSPEAAATGKKDMVEQIFGSTTDGGGGTNATSTMATNITNNQGAPLAASDQVKTWVEHRLGSTTDGNGGSQAGDMMAGGLGSQQGNVQNNALGLANKATGSMQTVNGYDPGVKGGSQFASGLGSQSGNVKSTSKGIAEDGKDSLASVKTVSVGESFASGFITGMKNGEGPVKSAARGLGNIALSALKGELKINSPSKRVRDEAGHSVGEGFEVGINEKIGTVQRAAQRMAVAAIPKVNPIALSHATQYLGRMSSSSDTNFEANQIMGRSSGMSLAPKDLVVQVTVDQPIIVDGRTVQRVVRKENYREDKINFLKRGQ